MCFRIRYSKTIVQNVFEKSFRFMDYKLCCYMLYNQAKTLKLITFLYLFLMKLRLIGIFWTELCLMMRPFSRHCHNLQIGTDCPSHLCSKWTWQPKSHCLVCSCLGTTWLLLTLLSFIKELELSTLTCWSYILLPKSCMKTWFFSKMGHRVTILIFLVISLMKKFLNIRLEEMNGRLGHHVHLTLHPWADLWRYVLKCLQWKDWEHWTEAVASIT